MPYRLHISEEEVREELRRLGHDDVPPHLVASFRKDLLKLIKSDIKQLKEKKKLQLSESSAPSSKSTVLSTTDATITSRSASQSNDSGSLATSTASDTLHSAPYWRGTRTTPLERALSQPSLRAVSYSSSFDTSSQDATNTSMPSSALGLQRQIDRRTRRARHRVMETAALGPSINESDGESGYSYRDESQSSSHVSHRSSSSGASTSSGVSSATASTRDSSEPAVEDRSRPLSGQGGDRARRAPSLPSYPTRTDPVSLYHYYKAHWDQRPPPGEDPRSSLRWKVRAQLFYSK